MLKSITADIKEIVEYGFEGIIKVGETSNKILQSIEIEKDGNIGNISRDIKELIEYAVDGIVLAARGCKKILEAIDIDKL